jgi:hypothetical protein
VEILARIIQPDVIADKNGANRTRHRRAATGALPLGCGEVKPEFFGLATIPNLRRLHFDAVGDSTSTYRLENI